MEAPHVVPTPIRNSNSNSLGSNSWGAWGKHVLAEQERQNNVIELLRAEVLQLHVEAAVSKVKYGMVGFLGGMVPVLIMIGVGLIVYLVKK